jgi:hypothetical protein
VPLGFAERNGWIDADGPIRRHSRRDSCDEQQ